MLLSANAQADRIAERGGAQRGVLIGFAGTRRKENLEKKNREITESTGLAGKKGGKVWNKNEWKEKSGSVEGGLEPKRTGPRGTSLK